MRVAVIGGTGTVGSKVVSNLSAAGHEILILSRNPPGDLLPGSSHHRIDLKARTGIDQALAGVETVIDVANEQKATTEVLVDGTRNLLERCRTAGVSHYVGISIIGCEKIPIAYYRAKTNQEEVIRKSPIGWSMLKASQFHELLDSAFTAAAVFRIAPTGAVQIQSVSASVVADRLASIAINDPTRKAEYLAGPQVETLSSMAKTWHERSSRRSLPLKLPIPGKVGKALRSGALTDPTAAAPGPTFKQWLERPQ